jgi:hypothetical protein
MQIVKLELPHDNFYCPVTGAMICNGYEANEEVPSLKAIWVDQAIEDPMINDPQLEKDWEKVLEKFYSEEEMNEYEEHEIFLKNYNKPNWVVFKITTCGIACGPVSGTAWFVIDMETQVEKEVAK